MKRAYRKMHNSFLMRVLRDTPGSEKPTMQVTLGKPRDQFASAKHIADWVYSGGEKDETKFITVSPIEVFNGQDDTKIAQAIKKAWLADGNKESEFVAYFIPLTDRMVEVVEKHLQHPVPLAKTEDSEVVWLIPREEIY